MMIMINNTFWDLSQCTVIKSRNFSQKLTASDRFDTKCYNIPASTHYGYQPYVNLLNILANKANLVHIFS